MAESTIESNTQPVIVWSTADFACRQDFPFSVSLGDPYQQQSSEC